jgi:hypothetical protein
MVLFLLLKIFQSALEIDVQIINEDLVIKGKQNPLLELGPTA